jgi:hypothetical protein
MPSLAEVSILLGIDSKRSLPSVREGAETALEMVVSETCKTRRGPYQLLTARFGLPRHFFIASTLGTFGKGLMNCLI